MNERAWVAEFATASIDRLIGLLREVTPDQEVGLRTYLGVSRYQRLRAGADRVDHARSGTQPRRNVIVIPGFMGSELSATANSVERRVWLNYFRLGSGWLPALRLRDNGEAFDARFAVRPTGILNKYYGELLLKLAATCNVRPFAYDWRKGINETAADLQAFIARHYQDQDVYLVAHAMGGLVARVMFSQIRRQLGSDALPNRFCRLITLGTPHHGSYEVPRILTGLHDSVRNLAKLVAGTGGFGVFDDALRSVQETINSFPSLYQMLPWSEDQGKQQVLEQLRDPIEYFKGLKGKGPTFADTHFRSAALVQQHLADRIGADRMVQVVGVNRPTAIWIHGMPPGDSQSYSTSLEGDGHVARELGLLSDTRATFFVDEEHGALPENPILLAAIESLLDGERTAPGLVTSWQAPIEQAVGRSMPAASTDFDELVRRLRSFAIRLRSGVEAETRPGLALDSMMAVPDVEQVSPDEEAAETRLLGGLLGRGAGTVVSNPATVVLNDPSSDAMLSFSGVESQLVPVAATVLPGQILIRVVHGGIEQAQDADAVSIGFYPGTRPQDAFAALDASVSAALRMRAAEGTGPSKSSPAGDAGGLCRNYVERGLLRAPFGQHFLFPDPRENPHCFPRSLQKIIAICSMGTPGRFGQPELVVLVRELAWSLGALGCHKLATVLIGARQNLSLQEAASGWLRGLARAADQKPRQGNLLECVTFVEASYSRATDLHKALQSVVLSLAKKKTTPNLFAIGPAPVEDEAYSKARQSAAEQFHASDFDEDDDPIATRVFVERQGKTWSLSAMTDKAAVPERLVTVDPTLVDQATRSLAGQIDADYQRRYGRTLETLVIPKDLREHLYGSAPLVLVVDATTARVPWEMLAQPLERSQVTEKPQRGHVPTEHFVGLSRGLTRQLRTQFAQPPEPPTAAGRELRILIVADPSSKKPLPGARQEGQEIYDLFDAYQQLQTGSAPRNIVIKRMIGPVEANRLEVLAEITEMNYDILHYCGHCFFDAKNPESSGWIFEDGVLSAQELTRLDRVPRFVFSNACESGITPERAEASSPALAPSFAEAFFRQGVSNFVCTGWPVDDAAARVFAISLYSRLLGLEAHAKPLDKSLEIPSSAIDIGTYVVWTGDRGVRMYEALRESRLKLFDLAMGRGSWGAYQHYGNPFFRLT